MTDIFFGISAKDWAEILRNYGLLIASFCTVWIAYSGLKAWKVQKIWESDRELAHDAVLCLFRLNKAVNISRKVTLEGSPLKLANSMIGSPTEQDIALAKFTIGMIRTNCAELEHLIDEMESNFATITILWGENDVAEVVLKVMNASRDLRVCLEAVLTFLDSTGQKSIPDILKNKITSPVLEDNKGSENWIANFQRDVTEVRKRVEPYIGRPS